MMDNFKASSDILNLNSMLLSLCEKLVTSTHAALPHIPQDDSCFRLYLGFTTKNTDNQTCKVCLNTSQTSTTSRYIQRSWSRAFKHINRPIATLPS